MMMLLPLVVRLQNLYLDRKGVTAVEYGLLLAFIAALLGVALTAFEGKLAAVFNAFTFAPAAG